MEPLRGWRQPLFEFLIAPANIWLWCVGQMFGLEFECGHDIVIEPDDPDETEDGPGR